MSKALLVVDMQNVCMGENHAEFFKYDRKRIIAAVNKAIDENDGNLTVYILNLMKKNLINRFAPVQVYEGTEESKLIDELHMVSDNIITKYEGDAFSNPALDMLLKEHNIGSVEIVGADGGGCAALTALGAVRAGYKVIVNDNAIGTMFVKNRDKLYKKLAESGAQII